MLRLLALAPLGAVAAPAATALSKSPAKDPVLRAVLEAGGRIRAYPAKDVPNGWVAWVENAAGDAVGFIHRSGEFRQITANWPAWR